MSRDTMISARIAALLALALAAAPGCAGSREGTGNAPAPIAPAETSVAFSDLDGIRERLAAERGRPVLVNLWATWCVPCMQELPELARLAREYGTDGPAFIGVSFDAWVTDGDEETEDLVRRALAEAGVAYPNLIYRGDQDAILSAFDLPGEIPYSILLDRDGRPAATWDGVLDADELRRAVADLH